MLLNSLLFQTMGNNEPGFTGEMSCQPIRVGIVGAGRMGRIRTLSANAHPQCKVVHVVDVLASSAQGLAAEVGCSAGSDWESLLARSDVDAVVVATPHKYLSPITVAALQAGKYVFCEKPMARRLDEAELVLRTASGAAPSSELQLAQSLNGSHNRVFVGYTLRHHPAVVRAKELVTGGLIGEPYYVRGRYGHGGRSGYEREWRGSAELSGGGELLDQGVHLIDLSRWFLGEFHQVTGFVRNYFWAHDEVRNLEPRLATNLRSNFDPVPPVEDNAFMLLRTRSQKIASLHASWTEWKNMFSFEIFGQKGFLAVEGLGGHYGPERLLVGVRREAGGVPQIEEISFAQPLESGGAASTQGKNDQRDGKGDSQEPDHASQSYWRAEWSAFVDAVQCARSRRIKTMDVRSANMFDARQNLEIVDAIYRSAQHGVVVDLEPGPLRTNAGA
jgi:predicted dehydrogenase